MADTTVQVYLITAKSRVAPLKVQTIPRLEVCGAHLLSNFLCQVSLELAVPEDAVYT